MYSRLRIQMWVHVGSDQNQLPSELYAKSWGLLCMPFPSGRVNSFHQILKDAGTVKIIALDHISYDFLDLCVFLEV